MAITALVVEDLVVQGSTGQPVINPLISEARTLRAQIAGLLARIKTDDPTDAKLTRSRSSSQARGAALSGIYGTGSGPGGRRGA